EHVLDGRVRGEREADHEPVGRGARGGEVAEVDRRRAPAEVAPRDPIEPEMDALDERILRDDDPARELGRVVFDLAREPAPLELGEEAELAELRELHARRLGLELRLRLTGTAP